MSFDGVFTHAMVHELQNELIGGRISKLHQPYHNEVVLVIRSKGKNHKLLLSAHPNYARVQISNIIYANPETPPNFIMMLRKYLDGAILEGIQQTENDRVIAFLFTKRDELGDLQNIRLIVELMGRHSTIVLVNYETGKILDAIKHISSSQNSYRSLLPGVDYIAPPQQAKINPFTAKKEKVFEILATAETLNGKYLQQHFQGLGKDTADELAFRLNHNPQEKMKVWQAFWQAIENEPVPTLAVYKDKEFFTPLTYQSLGEKQTNFPSLSELLDHFYGDRAEKERVKQQGNELLRKIENELKRNQTKLAKREQTLKDSENAEEFRRNGELLTTFMTQVPKGASEVTLENYYEENQPLVIVLNPALSPNQNAQRYFNRYQKLKNAVKLIHQQIQEAKDEIAYLESVQSQLDLANPMDIEVIKEELTAEGYIRQRNQRKKKQKASQPERFISSGGTLILVGKNNLQNDQLTLRSAKKTDIWLHAKNIPGSHVIIKDAEPSEETLLEAAQLAAYFSKYRHSAQVPVDYVAVKHVHKPNGAKPGFVIYENQKTLYVTPEEALITQLQEK
ncbi:putative ribosome quality control (RQC) complex YloA/Tae2 family protein [Enterococcus sp. PF1-24]|uniref:fibronectin-binding protein EfbA n=1 Tax=unclassified Enterococcus TaxID=2608891 RepID=UPI002473C719|nr:MULTISPECIES: fibronectin-binding protein EfbA [unclassified Enterococcus]MDH6364097.1 putative ribosome quality control (RQC) complex YloA/Tae2 family protein [Enterococcus sp. PFB1-1]MDH6401198.1 putative ribosome quality control (RQC) complex YloA/Tae2 family protein [Enterococcus sp. PF1-24]